MSDGFTLPRQACRCGHVFGSLQAHKAHAELAEPLPHDHPADVGLVQVDGEWVIKPAAAPAPKATRTASPGPKPTVQPAHKPGTRGTRTCKIEECDNEFDLPNRRGRPPVYCPEHRSK